MQSGKLGQIFQRTLDQNGQWQSGISVGRWVALVAPEGHQIDLDLDLPYLKNSEGLISRAEIEVSVSRQD
jgi:hypothetical protein